MSDETEHTFILGKDRHGREHTITVSLARSAEGVPALEIKSSRAGLRILPSYTSMIHVSTLDPRDIIKEKD